MSMILTSSQTFIMILAIALGTMITRFLPFILFPDHKEVPPYIEYLGKALPCAVMGLLVVYCLKDTELFGKPYALPETIAILCVIGIHLWRKNTLLSIGGGTLIYMLLVQYVFV